MSGGGGTAPSWSEGCLSLASGSATAARLIRKRSDRSQSSKRQVLSDESVEVSRVASGGVPTVEEGNIGERRSGPLDSSIFADELLSRAEKPRPSHTHDQPQPPTCIAPIRAASVSRGSWGRVWK
jgi:hypothetical protein